MASYTETADIIPLRKVTPPKEPWEVAFEDWAKLLKLAEAENLLQDPKAIWDEAWRQVAMEAIRAVEHGADGAALRKQLMGG